MPLIAKPTGILQAPLSRVELFCSKVKVTESCWLYEGYVNPGGYGQFAIKGSSRRAHRIMWELVGRKVDPTLQLDHLCRVRNCVNPDHLEQVTGKVNSLRGLTVTAENFNKSYCIHGHPFTPKNMVKGITRSYERRCRTCQNRMSRTYYQRNKTPYTYERMQAIIKDYEERGIATPRRLGALRRYHNAYLKSLKSKLGEDND